MALTWKAINLYKFLVDLKFLSRDTTVSKGSIYIVLNIVKE